MAFTSMVSFWFRACSIFLLDLFRRVTDRPYSLYLPSHTAAAWVLQKLPPDLQSKPLKDVLQESGTMSNSIPACARSRRLGFDDNQRKELAEQFGTADRPAGGDDRAMRI